MATRKPLIEKIDVPGYGLSETYYNDVKNRAAEEIYNCITEDENFRKVLDLPDDNPNEFRAEVSRDVAENYFVPEKKSLDREGLVQIGTGTITLLAGGGVMLQGHPFFGAGAMGLGAIYIESGRRRMEPSSVEEIEQQVEVEEWLRTNLEYSELEDDYLFELDVVDFPF